MAEKNILAYFRSEEEARGAEAKLQALRAIDTSVDRIGRFPGEGITHTMNPIAGDFPSLGSLTQGADFDSPTAGILAAADVTASGMSDGGSDVITGRNVLLTAVVDERVYEQALAVVRESGGMV
jgi:hypothetical protein